MDPTRFAQAIANLLNNAIRFTPEGGQIDLHATLIELGEAEGDEASLKQLLSTEVFEGFDEGLIRHERLLVAASVEDDRALGVRRRRVQSPPKFLCRDRGRNRRTAADRKDRSRAGRKRPARQGRNG